MPVVLSLFVIRDNGIVKKLKVRASDANVERLFQQDTSLVEELVYLVTSSLQHYLWDYVQLIGNDGGHLKNYTNPTPRRGIWTPSVKSQVADIP